MEIINQLDIKYIKQNPIKGYHSYRPITGGTTSYQHWISISPPGRGKGAPQRVLTKKQRRRRVSFCFFPGGTVEVEQMSIRISGHFRLLQFSGILSDVKSAKVGILLEVLVLFFDVFQIIERLEHLEPLDPCWSFLVGDFNPSEKYESQLGWLFPIYGKKHVPSHQPDLFDNLWSNSFVWLGVFFTRTESSWFRSMAHMVVPWVRKKKCGAAQL